jgi:hypothetical protein
MQFYEVQTLYGYGIVEQVLGLILDLVVDYLDELIHKYSSMMEVLFDEVLILLLTRQQEQLDSMVVLM